MIEVAEEDLNRARRISSADCRADIEVNAKGRGGVAVDDLVGNFSAPTPSELEKRSSVNLVPNSQGKSDDIIWVEFEKGDPENPFNFSKSRKWTTTILTIFFTAEVAATAGAYVPGIASMENTLHSNRQHELSLAGVSFYALSFAIAPLFLAPLSEVYGRNAIYLISHLCYTLLLLGTGFSQNIGTVLVLRFLTGAFGSTGSTMVGGTLSDIWSTEERGFPMSLFAFAAIGGTGMGPFIAGQIANSSLQDPWRWIQWIQAIYTGVSFLIFLVFLKETRGSVILTRRAVKLRKETGNDKYQARAESERASIPILIKNSLTRPLVMLFTEPIVLTFSLWIAFVWGFMYMLLSSIGLVSALHNYNPSQTGLVFLSICGGAVVGQITNPLQDYIYHRMVSKKGPEARLYSACIAAILFPVGCFIYGWTSYSHVSIAGPIVGITTLMTAIYIIYLAVFNYLADSYLLYASSALAAQSFARNLFACCFPLFVENMYHNLGYQWASTLSGLLGALLGVIPFVLLKWGHKIRAKSKLSIELQKAANTT